MNRRSALFGVSFSWVLFGLLSKQYVDSEKLRSAIEKREREARAKVLHELGVKIRYGMGLREINSYLAAPGEYQSDGSDLGDFLQQYTPDFPERMLKSRLARWNSGFVTSRTPETLNSLYTDLQKLQNEVHLDIIDHEREIRPTLRRSRQEDSTIADLVFLLVSAINLTEFTQSTKDRYSTLIQKYFTEKEAQVFKKMYLGGMLDK